MYFTQWLWELLCNQHMVGTHLNASFDSNLVLSVKKKKSLPSWQGWYVDHIRPMKHLGRSLPLRSNSPAKYDHVIL